MGTFWIWFAVWAGTGALAAIFTAIGILYNVRIGEMTPGFARREGRTIIALMFFAWWGIAPILILLFGWDQLVDDAVRKRRKDGAAN